MKKDPTYANLRVVRGRGARQSFGDPYESLVTPGEYTVALANVQRCVLFQRPTWETIWLIQDDGEHFGLPLYCWWRIPDRGTPIRPSHSLAIAYTAATELRPPRDLARRNPFWFLADSRFRAAVRTVNRNRHGQKRPDAASYSRVDYLIELVAGTPPCLRERPR